MPAPRDLAPLRRCEPPIPVEVLVRGRWWPGYALAWRGRRVSTQWTEGIGLQHLMWVDAEDVRRV